MREAEVLLLKKLGGAKSTLLGKPYFNLISNAVDAAFSSYE